MNSEFEQDLANASPPEYENPRHRELLRTQLLGEFERRRQMTARRKRLAIVYCVVALVGVSTFVVAHPVLREYVFKGKKDGFYIFTPKALEPPKVVVKDGQRMASRTHTQVYITSDDPNFKIDVDRTRQDLEEIDWLRGQGRRELMKVHETEVEGEANRTYIYKYALSDGRFKTMGESNPDETFSMKAAKAKPKEVLELRRSGAGELLAPKEEALDGRMFTFERYRLILKDGTEVIHSVGVPRAQETVVQAGATGTTSDIGREGFSLQSNLPNPFNPETVIRYETGEAGPVRIVVYNVVGQRIRTLVDQGMAAGLHQARWDGRDETGRDVASGTYLVRMDAERFSQTRKILLLR